MGEKWYLNWDWRQRQENVEASDSLIFVACMEGTRLESKPRPDHGRLVLNVRLKSIFLSQWEPLRAFE